MGISAPAPGNKGVVCAGAIGEAGSHVSHAMDQRFLVGHLSTILSHYTSFTFHIDDAKFSEYTNIGDNEIVTQNWEINPKEVGLSYGNAYLSISNKKCIPTGLTFAGLSDTTGAEGKLYRIGSSVQVASNLFGRGKCVSIATFFFA